MLRGVSEALPAAAVAPLGLRCFVVSFCGGARQPRVCRPCVGGGFVFSRPRRARGATAPTMRLLVKKMR